MAVQPGGYLDRPQDDNTHNAHPAWKRDGSGTINSPEIEKIRRSVFLLRNALAHASDKSTYLSKQAKEALDEAIKVAETLRYQKG